MEEDISADLGAGFNLQALMDLKRAFTFADTDGSGALDKDEFVSAFKKVEALSKNISDMQLQHLFMKIDANSDGTVDWDEFTNYILLQQMAKEELGGEYVMFVKAKGSNKGVPLTSYGLDDEEEENHPEDDFGWDLNKPIIEKQKPGQETLERKGNLLEKIVYIPQIQQYVSASQDGLLKLWNGSNLQHVRTIRNGHGAWITDMVAMVHQPLAVFALDRSVTFYDVSRPSFDVLGRIENLEQVPMCATWLRLAENDILVYGDGTGQIHSYTLADEWGGDVTRVPEAKDRALPGMTGSDPWKVHADWITRIKYLPHSNSLITCAMDSNLMMLDIEKKKVKWAAKEHLRGIYSCDFCRSYNFIVTCGMERHMMIWNPFTAKTLALLQGHQSSVLDVIVNEADNQIISLGTDKVIKVWDVRSNRCMQTLHASCYPGACTISYNPKNQVLLAGGSVLEMWQKKKGEEARASDVCCALYSPSFRQLVVGEIDSQIRVWSIDTGEPVFSFTDLIHKDAKISTMAFDTTGRRLLLGYQDGNLRMWNFNNGQCLKDFTGFGDDEITCATCIEEGKYMFVAAAGWNCKVRVWEDGIKATEPVYTAMKAGHLDDVICMSFCPPNSLATGGFDGKVIIWKLDGVIKSILKPTDHHSIPPDDRPILSLVYISKQEKMLVAVSANGSVRFWRLSDCAMVFELWTGHTGSMGPICIDAANQVMYSVDTKGFVKCWDLTGCKFRREDSTSPSTIRERFCWRAGKQAIVSIYFVEEERLVLTTSASNTSRLWTEEGTMIGKFGQEQLWKIGDPTTWVDKEPFHVTSQDTDGPLSSSCSADSRAVSRLDSSPEEDQARRASRESTAKLLEQLKEESLNSAPQRWLQVRVDAVLDKGHPMRRKPAVLTQMEASINRQLPIKAFSPAVAKPDTSAILKSNKASLPKGRKP